MAHAFCNNREYGDDETDLSRAAKTYLGRLGAAFLDMSTGPAA
jgi:hypothetical protein